MTTDKDSGGAFAVPAADRTVQVPVSLIEGLRDALAAHDDPHCEVDNYASDQAYISHVNALLSQPTPPAEPSMGVIEQEVMMRAAAARRAPLAPALQPNPGWHLKRESEPPRIEDMAPGTTFTAQMYGGNTYRWVATNGTRLRIVGKLNWCYADAIDLSTIRDVTPPTQETK